MAESTDLSISPSDPPLVAIALGSNLGEPLKQLQGAVSLLRQSPGIQILACSHWYRTAPLGPPQPDYWNGCVSARVQLSPRALLQLLQAIEQHFGRQRQERWGPRRLDLDLLFYGDQVVHTPDLILPHPRMAERPFVLVPLAELVPHWRHPLLGETVQTLRHRLGTTGIIAVVSAVGDGRETSFATAADSSPPKCPPEPANDERPLHS